MFSLLSLQLHLLNMNLPNSHCSSGFESGWTMYLDQSSNSSYQHHLANGKKAITDEEQEQEQEDDLSMVSDASSGPPHFHGNDYFFEEKGYSSSMAKEKKTMKEQSIKQSSYLDDTASSHVLGFSKKKNIAASDNQESVKNGFGFSQGFSATHSKGKSSLRKHMGFLKPSSKKSG